MSNRVRPDRLSNLPLSIIHEILVRVPIEVAIRTALLSKQWRYNWTTLPHLIFDRYDITEDFVSNVLLHHKGPIHTFEVYNFTFSSIDPVEEWIVCLSRKDIRDLDIYMEFDSGVHDYELKSGIYSCVKLTKLSLKGDKGVTLHPPPSSFTGFLALNSLELHDIDSNGVESIIACCPFLETLRITYWYYNSCSELNIRSRNLKNLHLRGHYEKLCVYSPVLAQMSIGFPSDPEMRLENYEFFGCFTNLVKLSLRSDYIQNLSIGIHSCHQLRVMKLVDVDFAEKKAKSVIARLILAAPNLHKLEISNFSPKASYEEDPYVSFKDIGFEPNFKLGKLRDVSLIDVSESLFGMHLIKFLLESSPVLDTFNLGYLSREALVELVGFRRSSANVRILVK